eukprot:UN32769
MASSNLFPITVIGSYPKPAGLKIPDWFNVGFDVEIGENGEKFSCDDYTKYTKETDKKKQAKDLANAFKDVVEDQIKVGVDYITDGEVARENYIHYHCRHLNGFDFDNCKMTVIRKGATKSILPQITSKISAKEAFLVDTYKQVQKMSKVPVKVTVPGPMTIADTCGDAFYKDRKKMCVDIAEALRVEINRLVKAGCKQIQVDEPLFARFVKEAKEYGFDCLDACIKDLPADVYTTVHICCGYSDYIDQDDYKKAENHCYTQLAEGLDKCKINAVSIEDAHTRIPDKFFQSLKKTDLVLGSIKVVKTDCYTPEQIVKRVDEIIKLGIKPERILLAPDCGLAMCTRK